MRRLTQLAVCLVLSSLAIDTAAAQQGSSTADEAAIRELIERTEAANNAGDVEGWVSLFAEDGVYMPPGSPPVTTREGLIEMARAGFRHEADIEIEPVEIRIFGDWAFARSDATGTVRLADSGDVLTIDVKQIVIYRREPMGDWKIARLITNSNS